MLRRTDADIHYAVQAWCEDSTAVEVECGPITEWDTSAVTSMKALFKGRSRFNEDLSGWDVSKVTDMSDMFC